MLKTAANEAAGKIGHRGVLLYVEVNERPRTKLEACFQHFCYLSHSPMTMSYVPKIVTISAIM